MNANSLTTKSLITRFLTVLFIAVAIWLPRGLKLDQYVTPDEASWIRRSANFYFALGERKFGDTYQSEHPGVTTMWAGTAGFLARYPDYLTTGDDQMKLPGYQKNLAVYGHTQIEMLEIGRIFLVIGNTITLVLAFFFAVRLFGLLPATFGFLFIAFDPFFVAHTRFLHLDGYLSSAMLLALFAFLNYLKNGRLYELIIAGVATGVSGLTKSPAVFLGPIFGLIVLVQLLIDIRGSGDRQRSFLTHLWHFAKPLLVIGVLAFGTFVLLWPAMWGKPVDTMTRIVNELTIYAVEGHESPVYYNGQIYRDGQIGYESPFYLVNYLWRSTPIVLAGLLGAAVLFIAKKEPFARFEERITFVHLLIFVIGFALLMNLGSKKFDRYLLPVFPPLDLIAGLGWLGMMDWFTRKMTNVTNLHWLRNYGQLSIGVILMGWQLATLLSTYPYYLTYYNPLMGGPRKAPEVMQVGWGEGLDQAGRYLNEKPGAKDMDVLAWYGPWSFGYFFQGTVTRIPTRIDITDEIFDQYLEKDYAVIYIHQWQRQTPKKLLDYLAQKTPEKTIWLDGLEYVRIYNLRE